FDQNYRLGYMILDLNDPFHVLYRTKYPILEPQMEFEKKGIVDNVVFSCGAVEKDGLVYLYYGGADKVMCVATMEMKKLLEVI
ncbi:glycosidase, partial [Patescibacteria group bacterium]|nr:glycosidase [Patescibacteria group bacterium]